MKRAILLTAGMMLLAAPAATADVYLEIVEDGYAPDGFVGHQPFFYTGTFDVFVWGTGLDTDIFELDFSIVFEDIYGMEIQFQSLGELSGSAASYADSHGTLDFDRISGIAFSGGMVPLPQGLSSAELLYNDFDVYYDGRLDVQVNSILTSSGPSPTVHTIGTMTSPEPGTLSLLAVLTLAVRRRR